MLRFRNSIKMDCLRPSQIKKSFTICKAELLKNTLRKIDIYTLVVMNMKHENENYCKKSNYNIVMMNKSELNKLSKNN